jgi:uncharacterized cupredoxin-like copper-binding protein
MSRRLLALLVPAATLVAGCNSAPPKAPATVLTLTDYAIATPASIPASMASFTVVNNGKEAHQAALVRLDSGKTYADFQAVMKDTVKGPPPAWIVWQGGANSLPGDTANVTIPMAAGNYVWYCMIPDAQGVPHLMKGMSAPFSVTASSDPMAAAPTADIDVNMKDYQWDLSTPVSAGKHTFKFTTAAGSQTHEFALVRLAPGKTAKDFIDWTEKMAGPPPIEGLRGVAGLAPGAVNYSTVEFKPGNYALICFLPDAADGKPHAMHGMVKEFTVQ